MFQNTPIESSNPAETARNSNSSRRNSLERFFSPRETLLASRWPLAYWKQRRRHESHQRSLTACTVKLLRTCLRAFILRRAPTLSGHALKSVRARVRSVRSITLLPRPTHSRPIPWELQSLKSSDFSSTVAFYVAPTFETLFQHVKLNKIMLHRNYWLPKGWDAVKKLHDNSPRLSTSIFNRNTLNATKRILKKTKRILSFGSFSFLD